MMRRLMAHAALAMVLAPLGYVGSGVALAEVIRPDPTPAAAVAQAEVNPFATAWTAPFGAPAFDRIGPTHFEPAFAAAMADHRTEIAAITANRARPTFANTVEALERAGGALSRVQLIFANMTSANTSEALQAVQRTMAPVLSRHSTDILLDPALFARVKAVYEQRARLRLTGEQARLLERTYASFVRAGAALTAGERARVADINDRLARLTVSFSQNMLADTRQFALVLDSEADLAGLPDAQRAAAAEAARERGMAGKWVITLSRSSVEPFLTYSDRRDLREKAFRGWASRGDNNDAEDNKAIVAEILALRAERARLLGFDSHAHFALADTMAKTPEAAMDLMLQVWRPAVRRVAEDRIELQKIALAEGREYDLEAWDWRYFAEKQRKAQFDLDEAEIKPYLQLDRMLDAQFAMANRLWGVTFTQRTDIPVYHPDVRVWEVRDADGSHIGLFYGDFFARANKQSGAWMSSYRIQEKLDGEVTPIVVNVLNYAKAPEGQAPLLSFDDAVTLFHEFGHALHGLLSDVTYASLAGTAVSRDFVEFPAQVLEHWAARPELLSRYAVHVETGKPMPKDLIDRLVKARTHNQGFATVEFLASALVDMDWHLQASPDPKADLTALEEQTLSKFGMPREIIMRHRPTHFSHIFAGGYSAGYYSYMWAEVMDADGFAAFTERGDVFDPELARRLRREVYAVGNTRDPAESYAAFRGRAPTIDALLRNRGFAQ
jgi:peptidyl-dipeptidase Dcp